MIPIKEILEGLFFLFKNSIKKQDYLKFIKLINKVICYNQGELAQYYFFAGKKHKELEDLLHASPTDIKGLSKCKNSLWNYLNTGFEGIARQNFKYIKEYFNGRAKIDPRVCIKLAQEDKIFDFVREEKKFYFNENNINSNKGFQIAHNTLKWSGLSRPFFSPC